MYHGNYQDEHVAALIPGAIAVGREVEKFMEVDILDNRFKSVEASTRKKRGSYALVYYQEEDAAVLRHCQLQCLFRHTVMVKDENRDLSPTPRTLAFVK